MLENPGQAVQIVGEGPDGKLQVDKSRFHKIMSHQDFQRHKVAILAIAGNDKSSWKTFLCNALLHYLDAEGSGDWLGKTWRIRTENLFHGNEAKPISNGIYAWSHPYLFETSSGEKIAVLLLDVITDEPGNLLNALAALICSTWVWVSDANIESITFSHLYELISRNDDSFRGNINLQQLVAAIFDFPEAKGRPMGLKSGLDYLTEEVKNTRGASEFISKIRRAEGCLFPQQVLNDVGAALGKDFVRVFKKLVPTILDADDMPVIAQIDHSRSPGEDEFADKLDYFATKMTALGSLDTDVEMYDLSNDEPKTCACVEEQKKILSQTEMCQDGNGKAKRKLVENQKSHRPSLGGHLVRSKVPEFEHNQREDLFQQASPQISLRNSEKRCTLTNQQKDELLQRYINDVCLAFSQRLQQVPLHVAVEVLNEQFLDYGNVARQKLHEFCSTYEIGGIVEKQNIHTKQLKLMFHKEMSKRYERPAEPTNGQNEIESAHNSSTDSQVSGCGSPELSEEAQEVLKNTWIDNEIEKYKKIMTPQCFNIDIPTKDILEYHNKIASDGRRLFEEYCESHSLKDVAKAKNTLDRKYIDEVEIIRKESVELNSQHKLQLDQNIESALYSYPNFVYNELKEAILRPLSSKDIMRIHEKVLAHLTPESSPAYTLYVKNEIGKKIENSFKYLEKFVNAIVQYSEKMNKHFDLYICFTDEKFNEFSEKSKFTGNLEFPWPEFGELYQEGLRRAEAFFRERNMAIIEHEKRIFEFTSLQMKNFYNEEMKARLELNIFPKPELKEMHDELKKECIAAANKACDSKDVSGIPSFELKLGKELDKCFLTHSNSNDSKLDKCLQMISAAQRKFKSEFHDIMEKTLDTPMSPKAFKKLQDGTFREISKLFEMEIQKIPQENSSVHLQALKIVIEKEVLADLRDENEKKWKTEEAERNRKAEEEKKERLRQEADNRKREQEEQRKREKDAFDERQLQKKKEEQMRLEQEQQKKFNQSYTSPSVNTSSSSDPSTSSGRQSYANVASGSRSQSQYETTNSEYGSYTKQFPTQSHGFSSTGKVGVSPVIAIEFGLKTIRAGVITGDQFRFIKNEHDEEENFNIIGIDQSNVFIGSEVYSRTSDSPMQSYIMEELLSKSAGKVDPPGFFSFKGKELKICKELLCALILSQIKNNAQVQLRQEVSRAVITVPMWYNSKQRQQMKDSAQIAGFSDSYLINEPTAVALACARHEARRNSANDILVIVSNTFSCDAAVYSYAVGEVKMKSNCCSEQIQPGFFKSIKNWISWNTVEGQVISCAVKESKSKAFLHEVAIVHDVQKDWVKHIGRKIALINMDLSVSIIMGAAILAAKLSSGARTPIRDLCTFDFHLIENQGAKRHKMFQSWSPCFIAQNIRFGDKNKLMIDIFEGPEKLGSVKVNLEPEIKERKNLELKFKRDHEGIFGKNIETVNVLPSGRKCQVPRVNVEFMMDNLKPFEIEELQKEVLSMSKPKAG